ncbi:hypothetical protein JNB88_32875 [Rhizobium cauense]|nr:hypothetical protein [Rhizobium cauense]
MRFIVEETLDGRAKYLKAVTIAQCIFKRNASFDAQNDPCVRIAASHLRRALERYYLTGGEADPILISVPGGGYVPRFERRLVESSRHTQTGSQTSSNAVADTSEERATIPAKRETRLLSRIMLGALAILIAAVILAAIVEHNYFARATPPSGDRVTIIVVKPFEKIGDATIARDVLSGITDEIVVGLTKFKEIQVATGEMPYSQDKALPTFMLEGSVRLRDYDLRTTARLIRKQDGAVVWASDYTVGMAGKSMLNVEAAIGRSISAAVAAPFAARVGVPVRQVPRSL